MKKIVVTSGWPFTDIDALACSVAYTELLKLEHVDAEVALPGPLNKSITQSIRSWSPTYRKRPETLENNFYVLVDISDPKYFAEFVEENKVIEIFDHHEGFADYWRGKIGKKSRIEMIGACATLIWEEYKKADLDKDISKVSTNLLYTAIASNTLNFNAEITNVRDRHAFIELEKYIDLPDNWVEKYFKDQDKLVFNNPKEVISNDLRRVDIYIAQVEMWESSGFIKSHKSEIRKVMDGFGNPNWFVTAPSIGEGKNYLFTRNLNIRQILEKAIGAKFEGDTGTTKKLWLRKEIMREIENFKKRNNLNLLIT